MKKLHLDIETYSSVDLKKSGVYKYTNSPDFEIMLIAFAFDNDEVNVIDLMNKEAIPKDIIKAFTDPKIIKCAHNANFERVCFSKYGYEIPAEQWECTAIKSAFCGYPLKLADVSEILDLGDKGKLNIGKDLIKYFCVPCKPTKVNNHRYRNLPSHSPEKWTEFKQYVKNDVIAEREIDDILKDYEIPEWEKINYVLDQKINDLGVKIDVELVKNAVCFSDIICENIVNNLKEHGIANPRSVQQMLAKINDSLDTPISSLDKNSVRVLLKDTGVLNECVVDILKSRVVLSKTSNKKYQAMQMCSLHNTHESKGLFQFYGAGRTGRWAGRLIQLQNLPRNSMPDLDQARALLKSGNFNEFKEKFTDATATLSQLIRTAIIPRKGKIFAVADFSAIEARVLSWLAGEEWRLEVFRTHGKIYEAAAALMYNKDIKEITKGSEYRQKGKIAELALGYQGSVGALTAMDFENKIKEDEKIKIVKKWRAVNPNIVKFWSAVDLNFRTAMVKKECIKMEFLSFVKFKDSLKVTLPSARSLFYQHPVLPCTKSSESKDYELIYFNGKSDNTGKWGRVNLYGGKLTENIVQAVARDLLADSMQKLNSSGYKIVMHVHDEVIIEIDDNDNAEAELENICKIMGTAPKWAGGLPLNADGYLTRYYKKD